jgi:hypothetical protein
VWQQIEREGHRPWIGWLSWAGAFAAACVLIAVVVLPRTSGEGERDGGPQRVKIVRSESKMRSETALIGDRAQIGVLAAEEARIYHADQLLFRCSAAVVAAAPSVPGCVRDGDGFRAELTFTRPGDYQVVILPAGRAEPKGSLDRDLAALAVGGGQYELHRIAVR